MNEIRKNLLYVSKSAREPITCFYKRSQDKPEDYHMHLNSMCEIYVFVAGDADYIVENRCFPIEPYDVIILNPYEPHMPLLKNDRLYERYVFLLPLDTFSFMERDPMEILIHENRKGNNRISLSREKKALLRKHLQYFRTEWTRGDAVASTYAYSAILGMLALLNEHILSGEGTPIPTTAPDMPPVIADALRYVEDNLALPFTVETIAENFHISVPYLSRLFKATVRIGLKKYILLRRIGYAKKLLADGKSVTDACFGSGFNDCSYFIKVFKSYTGTTPYKCR